MVYQGSFCGVSLGIDFIRGGFAFFGGEYFCDILEGVSMVYHRGGCVVYHKGQGFNSLFFLRRCKHQYRHIKTSKYEAIMLITQQYNP